MLAFNPLSGMFSGIFRDFFSELAQNLIDRIGSGLADIFSIGLDILSWTPVHNAILFTKGLAITFIMLKIIINCYSMLVNTDKKQELMHQLVRLFKALLFVSFVDVIIIWLYGYGSLLAEQINLIPGISEYDNVDKFNEMFSVGLTGYDFTFLFIIIFGGFAYILLHIQVYLRAFHLALLTVIGPIMGGIGLLDEDGGSFNTWFADVKAICFSQAVQMFLIKCTFFAAYDIGFKVSGFKSFMIFLAGMIATISAPKFLQKYMHSTGLARGVTGTLRSAGSYFMFRKMLR